MLIYEWILEKWGHISVNLYRYPRMWWWALLTYIHRTCSKVNFVFHISDHDDCTCHLTCHRLRPILYRGLCLIFITDEQWMTDGCCYQGPGAANRHVAWSMTRTGLCIFNFINRINRKVRHCDTWVAKISLQNRWNELLQTVVSWRYGTQLRYQMFIFMAFLTQ